MITSQVFQSPHLLWREKKTYSKPYTLLVIVNYSDCHRSVSELPAPAARHISRLEAAEKTAARVDLRSVTFTYVYYTVFYVSELNS